MLGPGSKIAGYVVEEQIGAGGMAVVYRARNDVLGRLVAVKVLSPALAADEEFRVRFLRESRAVAAVDESHIVPVYGAGDADGVLYIATRFVVGGDLSARQRAAGGPLPPGEVADLISQVAARSTPRMPSDWSTAMSSRATSSSRRSPGGPSTRTCRTSGSPSPPPRAPPG
jgi:serine/threonine protein kinase